MQRPCWVCLGQKVTEHKNPKWLKKLPSQALGDFVAPARLSTARRLFVQGSNIRADHRLWQIGFDVDAASGRHEFESRHGNRTSGGDGRTETGGRSWRTL